MKVLLAFAFLVASFALFNQLMAQGLPAPAASVPAVVVPVVSGGFFAFVKANLAALALAVYAILDVVIALSPGLAANGLVHAILNLAAKASGQVPPPAA